MCKNNVDSKRRESSGTEVFMNRKQLHNIADSSESDYDDFFKICVNGLNDKPYVIKIIVNSVPIIFEVDTGSKISAINSEFYHKYFSRSKISGTKLKLHSYTGGTIEPLGFIIVSAQCVDAHGETHAARALPLYVIPGGGPPLMGRAWLRCLQLDKINIALHNIESCDESEHIVQKLSREFADVFAPGLGTCTSRFSLKLRDHKPIFIKARNLPLALRKPVEAELDRLVEEGTIIKILNSEYGTPIVPVVKRNGDIRICGDYKVTVNAQLMREPYPLPRIEELYATLSGAQVFSKIDLAHAYEQVLLEEDSQACTAISTHVGTFKYIRTPYGLSCIPEKFQKLMEEVMRGVPMTVTFIDDICVGGVSFNDNLRYLREVLARLQKVGLRIKLDKCEFFKKKVCYLGHIIDKNGLHPDDKKVAAILEAPRPEDVTQLKAFLGLVNYYGKFIARLSTILYPLYKLLKKDTPWNWDNLCDEAFSQIKHVLSTDVVLAHYDPSVELVLSVDSSAYGIGAVLAHRYQDGNEKPICYSSRTLSSAELSYSQLDKEALAIYFGVIKNHQYLYGRDFTIRTDHKPLSHIFGDKVGIPQSAASRLQRYAARLAAYTFSIEWIDSASNAPADCLSRLPLHSKSSTEDDDSISYLHFVENEFPINHKDIAKATAKDAILRNILRYISVGWPKDVSRQEKCYYNRRRELLIDNGCIVYNFRIVVPPVYRKNILAELHEGHLGIVKMKSIARSYVYWPGIDAEIESICKSCSACRQQRDAPPHAPLTPWQFPARPWQRLHADFGEYKGKHYLILIDAFSKWIEVYLMKTTNSSSVIKKLRGLFARFGLPSQIVTDNGPPFTSSDLKAYFDKNGIVHNLTSPYRPKGNGAAENAVKTVKNCIKKAHYEGLDVEQAIDKMLFQYRNCEHATTGVPPAVALLGRRLRGRLDLLRFDMEERVRAKQSQQVERAGGTHRDVGVGDSVLVRDYSLRNNKKWVEGRVSEQVGPASFAVNVPTGTVRRHADQILLQKQNRYSLSRASNVNDKDDTNKEVIDVTDCNAEAEPSVAVEEAPQQSPPLPRFKTIQLRPRHARSHALNID